VVTENPAVLRYIARRFPEAGLWPDDPREEADREVGAALLLAGREVDPHRLEGGAGLLERDMGRQRAGSIGRDDASTATIPQVWRARRRSGMEESGGPRRCHSLFWLIAR
jgi:glutathione S-transferase